MNITHHSLPRKGRAEMLLSILLAVGIVTAIILPSPEEIRRLTATQHSLFTLVENDYINPLFSSATAIRTLNGAAKQVAQFAGYDDFRTRLDIHSGKSIVSITRFSGDLLSMLHVNFALRGDESNGEPRLYISESFWDRAFARRADIIGVTLRLHEANYRIAGVISDRTGLLADTDIWVPISSRSQLGTMNSMKILGSLMSGTNWNAAQAKLTEAFNEYLPDQVYSQARGAKLLPLDKGVKFDEAIPVMAGRIPTKAYLWSGT